MTKFLAAALLSLIPAMAMPSDARTYLCIADKATGFEYSTTSKEWGYARFTTEDIRYLLKMTSPESWELQEFGKPEDKGLTFRGCSAVNDIDGDLLVVNCTGMIYFRFLPNTGRFTISFFGGYNYQVDGNRDADTPMIAIGKCSAL